VPLNAGRRARAVSAVRSAPRGADLTARTRWGLAADRPGKTDVVVVDLDDIGPAVDLVSEGAVRPASRGGSAIVVTALLGAACLVGVILRWWPQGALWLDEAQSVAFASLPLDEIPGALREDGAPPLYYLVLHGWMWLFGDSDVAVRALSALLSTLTVIVVAVIARRRWGPTVAVAATVLVATSPFAIRYASSARMYALVMLEVVLAVAVVGRALEAPRLGRLAAVTIASAALLFTHYWSLYLVITAAAVLWASCRHAPVSTRMARRRVAGALLGGFVLWLPWLPTFLFQARHTGTPWAAPANAFSALQVFASRVSGPSVVAMCLGALVAVGLALGPGQRWARPPAPAAIGLVGLVTAAVAVVGAIASSSAVSNRYFAVSVPLVLLGAAAGLARLRPGLRHVALAAVASTGLWLAGAEVNTPRTTALEISRVIVAEARATDVVVACPDQLAPAVHRLLLDARPGLSEAVFPPGSTTGRVNWIDYATRARRADPSAAAHRLLAATPDATIWLVVSTTYPPTQPACAGLLAELIGSRSARLISVDRPELVEHGALWRFDPGRPPIRR
jgi:mannosyltransferase